MKAITLKESEIFDSNLSMLVPLYPLSKEKFEILKKNSWDFQSLGGRFLAIFLAFAIKIVAVSGHAIYLAVISEDHVLKIDNISSIDLWTLGISFILWIICSFVIPKYKTSKRDEVIKECYIFYESKKQ